MNMYIQVANDHINLIPIYCIYQVGRSPIPKLYGV